MKLLHIFLQLALLKANPSALPSSVWLLKWVSVIYFIVGIFVSHIDYAWQISLVTSLTDTLSMLLFAYVVLAIRGKANRFLQTATALAGAGVIMNVIAVPVLWGYRLVETQQSQVTSLALLAVMLLFLWTLFVIAQIYRQSLDTRPGWAAIVTVIYILFSMIVVGLAISGVS